MRGEKTKEQLFIHKYELITEGKNDKYKNYRWLL